MWIILSFTAAIASAIKDGITKKTTFHLNTYIIAWAWMTSSLLFLLPTLFITGFPALTRTYLFAFIIVSSVDFVTLYLYVLAIKLSPISLTLPMLSLTPLIITITSIFINQEIPHPIGITGIILVVLGTYLLHFDHITRHLLSPFRSVVREKGVLLMFIIAILWGLTGSLHKLAVSQVPPMFHGTLETAFLSCLTFPLAYFSSRKNFTSIFTRRNIKIFLSVGFLDALVVIAQLIAMSVTFAAFPVAVKRTSILFTAFFGWYYFGEHIKERVMPICLMVTGIILIAFA